MPIHLTQEVEGFTNKGILYQGIRVTHSSLCLTLQKATVAAPQTCSMQLHTTEAF